MANIKYLRTVTYNKERYAYAIDDMRYGEPAGLQNLCIILNRGIREVLDFTESFNCVFDPFDMILYFKTEDDAREFLKVLCERHHCN